jgi:hypothetical protein
MALRKFGKSPENERKIRSDPLPPIQMQEFHAGKTEKTSYHEQGYRY